MNNNKFEATLRPVEIYSDGVSKRNYTLTGIVKKKKDGTFVFKYKDYFGNNKMKFEYFCKETMIFKITEDSEHGALLESILD